MQLFQLLLVKEDIIFEIGKLKYIMGIITLNRSGKTLTKILVEDHSN